MRRTLPLLALLLAAGCAAPYTVRTAGKGKTALHASVGGPLVGNFGGAVPAPAVVFGARRGLTDDWDIHGSFHLLPTIFGAPGIDVGVTRRIVRERGLLPEITATFRLPLLTDFRTARVYPEVEAYASYLIRDRALLYFGATALFDFFWPKDQHLRMIWGPVLGTDVRFRKRYALTLALRWISPQSDTSIQVVDYITPLGMLFIQLGFQANLGGWR